jgi:hypothetical protein
MKSLFFFASLFITVSTFSQRLKVTPDGLLNADDPSKHYVVIHFDSVTANDLFARSYSYVEHSGKSPDITQVTKKEAEYIHVKISKKNAVQAKGSLGIKFYISLHYILNLDFKDNKIKYEITELEMTNLNTNGEDTPFYFKNTDGLSWSFYNKDGTPVEKENMAREQLENYFNNQIMDLKSSILSVSSKTDF